MPGNWTDAAPPWLGPSESVGSIHNADVLIAAATVLALAIFLPASRDGGAVFFGTDAGKRAFRWALGALVFTVAATALSTWASFALLVFSLVVLLSLGSKALSARSYAEDAESQSQAILRSLTGRPAGQPAPPEMRCKATRKRDGARCMNAAKNGNFCGIHLPEDPEQAAS
jgi:predicted metal-binding membrane protein